MTQPYRGLTWDHPRGYNALAATERDGGPVHWDVQPLEGFESAPIADLCAAYDLVVLDHPHLGEALTSRCIQPLDALFSAKDLDRLAKGAVGPSCDSYAMAGHLWALPLDAATQVMATRPDLLDHVPKTWGEVIDLSKRGKVALSLAGPHAFLNLLSICAAIEPDLNMGDGGWPEKSSLRHAYGILAELAENSPASVRDKNPIGILDHMSINDDVALVPLIYGYVNYSNAQRNKPIQFHDAPHFDGGLPGSIIGGTGIAVSTRVEFCDELRNYLLGLISPETQSGFIPDNDGQPVLECAWRDAGVNAACSGFYENTLATLGASTIRPRHDGYILFQSRASAYLRDVFENNIVASVAERSITVMFEASRAQTGIIK